MIVLEKITMFVKQLSCSDVFNSIVMLGLLNISPNFSHPLSHCIVTNVHWGRHNTKTRKMFEQNLNKSFFFFFKYHIRKIKDSRSIVRLKIVNKIHRSLITPTFLLLLGSSYKLKCFLWLFLQSFIDSYDIFQNYLFFPVYM